MHDYSIYLPNVIIHFLELAQPDVTVGTTTATSISLSWTSAGSEVDNYEVMWTYDGECSDVRGGRATVAGDMTSYTIEGLEEYITYSITVTATNNVGSAVSEVDTVRTREAGEVISQVANSCTPCAMFHSLQLLLVLLLQLVPLAHPPPSQSSGGQWTASTAMET